MANALVHRENTQGVLRLTMDSPHNRNALSAQMRSELRQALAEASTDETVRVIVLGHTGPVFCSGMDLREDAQAAVGNQGVQDLPEILRLIWESPKPVVAAAAGPARAGGVGLLASADIVIASEKATFAFTEVRLGLVPAVITLPVLARMQQHAAYELLLTGEVFDARHAADIGLVNATVPEEQLEAETQRYTRMFTSGAPRALAATKHQLRRALSGSESEVQTKFDTLLALSAEFFAGPESAEGRAAFAEKRAPNWAQE